MKPDFLKVMSCLRFSYYYTRVGAGFKTREVDILGFYIMPPKNALVLCVDENTAVRAQDGPQPNLPLRPGQKERRFLEYIRNGITSLQAGISQL